MTFRGLTDEQRRAVECVDRSLLVDAAAGAGKTTVLAQRCLHLICDAPEPFRCNVDELLVLTFTEAAATEMRQRIINALRARLEESPADARLRQQVIWADLAQISTIHSFCLWLLRRNFVEAGIDPAAAIMDEHEAAILRRDALERLFDRLYRDAAASSKDANSGGNAAAPSSQGAAFVKLVEDYGLGDDGYIAAFVLRLAAFLESLPSPEAWLDRVCARIEHRADEVILDLAAALRIELCHQADAVEAMVEGMNASSGTGAVPARQDLAKALDIHVSRLKEWSSQIEHILDSVRPDRGSQTFRSATDSSARATTADAVDRFEFVRQQIADYVLQKPPGVRRNKRDVSPEALALNAAIDDFDKVRDDMFEGRVRRWVRFSADELRAGLALAAPYVRTLVELTRAFEAEYRQTKRRLAVLDFADLEQLAYRLLTERHPDEGERPSAAARNIRRQFAHVLVDEYQDINPLQEAIIRRISREEDADMHPNLFVVGDVKQSIYRFRLAEPELFVERAQRLRTAEGRGVVISLQSNFRSARPVLDFINLVFASLMAPGLGSVVYDDQSVLRHARTESPGFQPAPVEIHLLDRGLRGGASTEPDESTEDMRDARHDDDADDRTDDLMAMTVIEREALLIGRRIRELMTDAETRVEGRRLLYRDFVILLRSARQQAQRIEAVLRAMGIPTFTDAAGEFLHAREVREVLAALRVLDNPQQDIPLVSALRAGLFGPPIEVDDLADIRACRRDVPFHLAVIEASKPCSGVACQEHLAIILERIEHYRRRACRQPLADVLWELYEESGYLARVGAWPYGPFRRANLIRLHDYARRFATFRQQGLHRFLRFVESIEEESNQPANAGSVGEGEDAVRIMTVHKAKGLEFPVVFVAGLGNAPNLEDVRGRMLFGRRSGIGLRVVDPTQFIEYPSAAHALVCDEVLRYAREEEIRILYVAMTRARDRLILIGSPKHHDFDQWYRKMRRPPTTGPRWAVLTGSTPLDWLMPVVAGAGEETVAFDAPFPPTGAVATVIAHPFSEIQQWHVERFESDSDGDDLRARVARLEPLPALEPVDMDDPQAGEVVQRVRWVYPFLAASAQRAVVPASGFKTPPTGTQDEAATTLPVASDAVLFALPRMEHMVTDTEGTSVDARVRGTVTHRVFQHLDIPSARGRGPDEQIAQLVSRGLLSVEHAAMIDVEGIRWFLTTDAADLMCDPDVQVRREFAYITCEPIEWFDASAGPLPPEDRVLVRGIVDAVLVAPAHLDILDYKTDALLWDEVPERAEWYRPQVVLYARAMSRLWRRPVRSCRLIFLSARRIITWGDAELSRPIPSP